MSALYAGTSGWSYPQWKPAFYPAKLPPAKFLGYYATRLNTVEVNYTFRRFPAAKLLGGWVTATPDTFRFAMKAHQSITHVKRLKDAKESVKHFSEALEPLRDAGRLGPVLFQLPPFLKRDVARLTDFLSVMPGGLQAAFEFRHESWFEDEIFALLRQSNAALCLAESDKLETPYAQTADFSYMRLRKQEYSAAARKALSEQAAKLKGNGDVFVYFKHEDSPEGALYAEELLSGAR